MGNTVMAAYLHVTETHFKALSTRFVILDVNRYNNKHMNINYVILNLNVHRCIY